MSEQPVICFLCTGNAARSVMAAAMMRSVTDHLEVRSAGTHSIEGLPMSVRTRTALARHDLRDPFHRSRQMAAPDVEAADLVVAMEPLHVAWVRRHHPSGAPRTATLRRLIGDLDRAGQAGSLADRVAALALDEVEVEQWETVVDPESGDQEVFDRCADELMGLVSRLHRALG